MSPLSDKSSQDCLAGNSADTEFTMEERALLLQLAHAAIASVFTGQEIRREPARSHFAEHRGVFTTLYLQGVLRGCVGYVLPLASLYSAVVDTARGAAFEDPRFPPVTADEVHELKVSLSILSPLKSIQPEEVEIGCHGLLVEMGERRGLLLPQVPVEHGWDRSEFLAQTCRKAGLPADAWLKGAVLEAFTAEVFGEV